MERQIQIPYIINTVWVIDIRQYSARERRLLNVRRRKIIEKQLGPEGLKLSLILNVAWVMRQSYQTKNKI